jgi:hypothetical protein
MVVHGNIDNDHVAGYLRIRSAEMGCVVGSEGGFGVSQTHVADRHAFEGIGELGIKEGLFVGLLVRNICRKSEGRSSMVSIYRPNVSL